MTKFIDLDSVTAEPEFVLKLKGVEHALVPTSVEAFMENVKLVESLGLDSTPTTELEVTLKMVMRAFPTISRKELMQLTLPQLKLISETARGVSAENVTTEAEAAKAGDAGKAQPAT